MAFVESKERQQAFDNPGRTGQSYTAGRRRVDTSTLTLTQINQRRLSMGVDPVENSLVYYSALRMAGVPAEMHLLVKGGHAFGLRPTDAPITRWPQLVETWLTTIGMTSK